MVVDPRLLAGSGALLPDSDISDDDNDLDSDLGPPDPDDNADLGMVQVHLQHKGHWIRYSALSRSLKIFRQ
jgi:hypothetical protein